MSKITWIPLCIILMGAAADAAEDPQVAAFIEKHAADEILLKMKNPFEGEALNALVRNIGLSYPSLKPVRSTRPVFPSPTPAHPRRYDGDALQRWVVIKVEAESRKDLLDQIETYKDDPGVEWAQPNFVRTVDDIPNDPHFALQWSLHNIGQTGGTRDADIDAPEAWHVKKGIPRVVIAILDTGVDYNHPDLADVMWTNEDEIPDNGVDDDLNGYIDDYLGYDFTISEETGEWDNDPLDEHGHGTHCSGIAAASTHNNVGIAGVACGCRIMPVKGFSAEGWGYDTDLAPALVYAADNGADVISNSWGGYESSKLIEDAVDYAAAISIVVASAGNLDSFWRKNYPAAYDEVISVAATDHKDIKASFSNYGSYDHAWIDIAAPGLSIFSTMPTYHVTMNDYGLNYNYDYLGGTSMAAPHVSGLAALVKHDFYDLSNGLIISRVLTSADPIDHVNPDYRGRLGAGRINAHNAVTGRPPSEIICKGYTIDDSSGDGAGRNRGREKGGSSKGNGFLEPGESIDFLLDLRNNGSFAKDVKATLRTAHPHVTITSPDADCGNLPSFETITRCFSFEVAPCARTSQYVDFLLDLRDSSGYQQVLPFKVEISYPIQAGWPVTSDYLNDFYSPTLGDLDGDGDLEVLMGSDDSHIYAFHHDGTPVDGWPVKITPFYTWHPPALADIDQDGKLEVFVSSDSKSYNSAGRIWGFHHDGTAVEGWPLDIAGEPSFLMVPALGDIDNDGVMEIVVSREEIIGYDGHVHIWRQDGTVFPGWGPKTIPDEKIGRTPALADYDCDGDLEIFLGAEKIYGWHHDGSEVKDFPLGKTGPGVPRSTGPVVGNLDDSGKMEVVATLQEKLYVLGDFYWEKKFGDTDWLFTPVLGDIDGDGDLEIVITIREYFSSYTLFNFHAFHHDGSTVSGWPVIKKAGKVALGTALYPVLGDVDGDGDVEIVISYYEDILAYHHDGKPIAHFPIRRRPGGYYSPALGDLDNDGDVEILVSYDRAFVFDCPGAFHADAMEWPMHSHDAQNSGNYDNK